jgi:hypothetical protein
MENEIENEYYDDKLEIIYNEIDQKLLQILTENNV